MEVCGQLQAPVALPRRKYLLFLVFVCGWVDLRGVVDALVKINVRALAGIEFRFPGSVYNTTSTL